MQVQHAQVSKQNLRLTMAATKRTAEKSIHDQLLSHEVGFRVLPVDDGSCAVFLNNF